MEIVKCKDQYKGTEDHNYFNAACKGGRELEEIDITDIIRRLK